MKASKKLAVQIVVLVLVLDISIWLVKGYRFSQLDSSEISVLLIAPLAFIVLGAILSFVVTSMIRGRFNRVFFVRGLSWSLAASFALAFFLLYQLTLSWKEDRLRRANSGHNLFYRHVYDDQRDENVAMAVDALLASGHVPGDVWIKRMRVLERDTVLDGLPQPYFDVQNIYCAGPDCEEATTYAARQLILKGNLVSLYMKEPVTSGAGALCNQEVEASVRRHASNIDATQAEAIAVSIAEDKVTLRD